MKSRALLSFFCINLMVQPIFAEKPVGFLWYNAPHEEQRQKPKGKPFSQLSYTEKDAVLHFYTMEALHKVRFTHKLEDERVFLSLQAYWLREASIHGALNQKALLEYPEYDFSVTHPTSDLGSKLYDSEHLKRQQNLVRSLAKHHGLLFFYRGAHPIDVQQIPILKDFCQKFHFHLMPVSVDGNSSQMLTNSKFDSGQATRLNIHYFPAIVLVEPNKAQFAPVAFGLTTQDVLLRRLNDVANHFKVEAI